MNLTAAHRTFVRSGVVNLNIGYLRRASSGSGYWTTTANDSDSANYLYITTYITGVAILDPRYYGFSARCLASGA